MTQMERWDLYVRICVRAEDMGIGVGSRTTRMMDLELADKHWNLRLEEWLEADDFNFAHDFVGIQNHVNRITKEFDGMFLPRFAKGEE